MLPGLDGLQVLARLRAHPELDALPVVVMMSGAYPKVESEHPLWDRWLVSRSRSMEDPVAADNIRELDGEDRGGVRDLGGEQEHDARPQRGPRHR